MNYRLAALGILLLGTLAAGQATKSARPGGTADPTLIAAGEWSEEVEGLRGRLVLAEGRKPAEVVTYLELRNAPEAVGNDIDVYVNPDLACEMRDARGKLIPAGGGFGGGGVPGPQWVTLSHDSTIRLRLSPYGFFDNDGQLITIVMKHWTIQRGEMASLSATFTSDPKDEKRPRAWKGTLKLSPVKIAP